jgi:hypothetical protein
MKSYPLKINFIWNILCNIKIMWIYIVKIIVILVESGSLFELQVIFSTCYISPIKTLIWKREIRKMLVKHKFWYKSKKQKIEKRNEIEERRLIKGKFKNKDKRENWENERKIKRTCSPTFLRGTARKEKKVGNGQPTLSREKYKWPNLFF